MISTCNRERIVNIEQLQKGLENLPSALEAMKFESLRDNQVDPINTILAGTDTFAVLATGGGKTALYAIPTLALRIKTLVFSPLIALMRDQVQSLNLKGLRCAAINTTNTPGQNSVVLQDWVDDKMDIMFMAPERLDNEQTISILRASPPDLVVVDEAHVMSAWSSGFRPAYKRCGELVASLNPKTVLALTATATDDIVKDVKDILKIPDCVIHWNYEARPNLKLSSEYVSGDADLKDKLLEKVRSIDGSIIVYADTIEHIGSLTEFLSTCGENVVFYHGKLGKADRSINQDAFMDGSARIIVATNSFGMGIDKPDIRGIIHAYPPGSIEAISQETGRASRDGEPAVCHMYFNNFQTQRFLSGMNHPCSQALYKIWNILKDKADKNNVVDATATEIIKESHLSTADGVEGAIGFLQYRGCIEKLEADKSKCYVIYRTGRTSESNARNNVLAAVLATGIPVGVTANGDTKFEVNLDLLCDTVQKTEATVKSSLVKLQSEDVIVYTKPKSGKLISLLREPTKEDFAAADERRNKELDKVNGVIDYCRCKDDKKQQFLLDYFTLKKSKK